jgi:tRNA-dihydrouridine synthase B
VTVHELVPRLVDAGAAAVTLHARCRNEGFSGQAKWEHIARLKESLTVPLLGNGDARSAEDVFRMTGETGCDGVMVGRAGLAKPWIFSQAAALNRGESVLEPGKEIRRKLILEHFRRLAAVDEPHRAVHRIRGFVAWYSRGVNGGALLRRAVNRAPDAGEFVEIVNSFFDQGHVS